MILSTPHTNCQPHCDEDVFCTGYDNRHQGCTFYRNLQIAQSTDNLVGVSCYKKRVTTKRHVRADTRKLVEEPLQDTCSTGAAPDRQSPCSRALRQKSRVFARSSASIGSKHNEVFTKRPGLGATDCFEVSGGLYMVPILVDRWWHSLLMCLPDLCIDDEKHWAASEIIRDSVSDRSNMIHDGTGKRAPLGFIAPVVRYNSDMDFMVLPVMKWDAYYNKSDAHIGEQWDKLIFPLIRRQDFTSVLEIGAGACRNSLKLALLTNRLVVTDINQRALARCRRRFEQRPVEMRRVEYMLIDGLSVPLKSETVSFVYQFDSGVHFHRNVIKSYLLEFARLLVAGGSGFFHYSNLAASGARVRSDIDITYNSHGRANMSRAVFEDLAKEAGLEVYCNTLLRWAGVTDLDAIALFRKPRTSMPSGNAKQEPCPEHLLSI